MTFFCVKTRIFVAKVHFLLGDAKLFHRFNSSENTKKGHDQSCPKYYYDSFVLFYNNFLHATIAILHDIQSLGWTYQSLTIYRIARYLLNVGRGCYLINDSRVVFYNISKIAPNVSKEIVLLCALWYVQSAILFIYIIKRIACINWSWPTNIYRP